MPLVEPGSIVRGRKSVYIVEKLVAKGGMAEVWTASDLSSNARVALKIPRAEPQAVERARFELHMLKLIRHPHVVKLLDEAEIGAIPVLVEEFLNGVTLADLVAREGPLPEDEARARLTAILLALDAMHSHNIIHRDVKPRNVVVIHRNPIGTKLIDLGTAIYYNVSGVGDLVFSSGGYTAPEQYRAYALPQSDIWGAMATAFYMLTGIDPVHAMPGYPTNPPPKPPDPRAYNPAVSREMAEIIAKGLSWHVLDRYMSAREAIDALNGGQPVAYGVPVLEVMGVTIPVETDVLVFGRREEGDGEERVSWRVENGETIVEVADPYRWISRRHFEVRYEAGTWCIRDLGSTNRTAIMTKQGVFEVWSGKGTPSPCYRLEPRTIILVAYGSSLKNPPYVTAYFRID